MLRKLAITSLVSVAVLIIGYGIFLALQSKSNESDTTAEIEIDTPAPLDDPRYLSVNSLISSEGCSQVVMDELTTEFDDAEKNMTALFSMLEADCSFIKGDLDQAVALYENALKLSDDEEVIKMVENKLETAQLNRDADELLNLEEVGEDYYDTDEILL